MVTADNHALDETEKVEADFKEFGLGGVVCYIAYVAVGVSGVADWGNGDFRGGGHGGFLSCEVVTMLWGVRRKSRHTVLFEGPEIFDSQFLDQTDLISALSKLNMFECIVEDIISLQTIWSYQ